MTSETLVAALEAACARGADRVALTDSGARLSYRELWDDANALARSLRRLGIRPGARIVCHLGNRTEYVVTLAAAWACGAVHVGVDREFTGGEVARVIGLTGAAALVCDTPLADVSPQLAVVVVGDGTPPAGCHGFGDLIARGREADAEPARAPAPDDPAVIFISSGTTGQPKATIGFHGNLGVRWQRLSRWLQFSSGDTHLAPLPLTHGFGLMMLLAALFGGGRVVLQGAFRAGTALDAIAAEHVTVMNGTPTHFRLLLRELDRKPRDVRSLRLSAGTAAAFPPALIQQLWDVLGVELVVMYGSSEGIGVATSDRNDIIIGSVGKPQPGAAKIIGPDGGTLPANAVGEIAFSRRVYPMRYWQGENTAPAQDDDSWFRSGDLGTIDDEGRLFVFGRLTHVIDRGGMKVDPVEVERAILTMPNVIDAAVIGLPNPIFGEIVCACVVCAATAHVTLDDVRWALGAELASYKLPEELCVLDQIPRTSLGKVRRDALLAAVEATRERGATRG